MHDVAVRCDTYRPGEYAGKMERAPPRDICKRRYVDAFIEVGQDIGFDASKGLFAQGSPRLPFRLRAVPREQARNKAVRHRVPEKRSTGIVEPAFPRQDPGNVHERLVET